MPLLQDRADSESEKLMIAEINCSRKQNRDDAGIVKAKLNFFIGLSVMKNLEKLKLTFLEPPTAKKQFFKSDSGGVISIK